MMEATLETNEITELTGIIRVENKQVVMLRGSVATSEGDSESMNQTIIDQTLYNANKKSIRKAISDFQNRFYEIQDRKDEEAAEE
ncbi:hypothetical protein [Vagococcus intermedius]|uniref:Uncharacterized protein n=1 Tax=Vagococcus intermedius TaxID=2991418 RepID=A0AAF0CWU8_9ENTE|nr:hypothetical protein [Vagococcus intermedius]WEG74366.1 hypothetical protein OL234_10700 [Vagococcus intermedius]WEG76489.1 hypothetical protein OL235_10870 [Vagococcus intermedius]